MKDKNYLLNRITTANGPQLVALLYEELINSLMEATGAMEEGKNEGIQEALARGRDILAELLSTLEGDSEIAKNLRSLYLYVNRLMTEADNYKSGQKLQEAIKVLTPLYEGWRQLGEEQVESSLQKCSGRVTGLTYGKNQLNDFINHDEDKWKKG
ncbi:flagellar export chaperone FliS [Alkaliphilus hydrothermalis]|uniref:Flagellar protein FliS n=1 Tax=Alkaliphilus hydrothermalis TaxID=1482730 RepID=A0ABS2NR37_9FIRM|nr:flagellar protein FliS [Alkaliphilus hydrothermalis]MBM7615406.1 flagellar protein FliS [Alkaliphilus hydrothermalis]